MVRAGFGSQTHEEARQARPDDTRTEGRDRKRRVRPSFPAPDRPAPPASGWARKPLYDGTIPCSAATPGRFIESGRANRSDPRTRRTWPPRVAAFARRVNAHRDRPLRFSVNVSAIEFLHRDMADILDRVLRQTDAQPNWLTLEITESMLLDNTPSVLEAFRRLRELGVGLSVDISELAIEPPLARDVPGDRDQDRPKFVGDVAASPSKTVIVRAIIDPGRALGLAVVAEGVETEAQRTTLGGMGCPIGQRLLIRDSRRRRKLRN